MAQQQKKDRGNCDRCGRPLRKGQQRFCSRECAQVAALPPNPSRREIDRQCDLIRRGWTPAETLAHAVQPETGWLPPVVETQGLVP